MVKRPVLRKPSLESIVRLQDEIEDFLMSTWFGLRRMLSRKPRERRRVPRSNCGVRDESPGDEKKKAGPSATCPPRH